MLCLAKHIEKHQHIRLISRENFNSVRSLTTFLAGFALATSQTFPASTSTRLQSATKMPKRAAPEASNNVYKKSKKEKLEDPNLKHPSTSRAKEVDANLPFDALTDALDGQPKEDGVSKVVHWFRAKDLRIQDNIALYHASELAKKEGKPLIGIYLDCPTEYEWHGTSPARVDFILENLYIMQKELK